MSSFISESVLAEYKEAFSMFDLDGDGTIDLSELGAVLRSVGVPATPTDIEEIMSIVDTDKSGTIDFEEFCQMMAYRGVNQPKTEEKLVAEQESVFRAIDKDGDGWITQQDLAAAFESMKHTWGTDKPPTQAELEMMLQLLGKQEEANGADFYSFVNVIELTKQL